MEHTVTRMNGTRFQPDNEESASPTPVTYKELEFLFRILRGKGHEYEHYESSFEKTVRDVFIDEKINFLYEPLKFRIHDLDKLKPWEYTYTPDFLLEMKVNGKVVIVEAKGRKYFDDSIFRKYSLFMKQYSDRFYFVIITDMPYDSISKGLGKLGNGSKISNEIWNVNHIHQGDNWKEHEEEEKKFIKIKLDNLAAKTHMLILRTV